MKDTEHQPELLPEIRLGRIGVLNVHQISDDELDRLAKGNSQTIFLNFAIAVLSMATSFLIALLNTTTSSDKIFILSTWP